MHHWLHFLFAAFLCAAIAYSRRAAWRTSTIVAWAAFAGVWAIAAVVMWPGFADARRTLTMIAMPCGVIWLVLAGTTFAAWRLRRRAVFLTFLAVLLLFTGAGNEQAAKLLFHWLEAPFSHINPMDSEELDAVVILGGATVANPNGYIYLNSSGDRVALGARLYHQGKTPLLIASAGAPADSGESRGLPGQRRMHVILTELSIPKTGLLTITGRNTEEEIKSIKELANRQPWRRVGLVTSAWHLRRAMNVAAETGLTVTPLPADFRSGQRDWEDFTIVPQGRAFYDLQLGAKEALGLLVLKVMPGRLKR